MKKRDTIIFDGEYRNVKFEINNFFLSYQGDCWTHYIFINIDKMIPDKDLVEKFWLDGKVDKKGRVNYDYYDSIISELKFHGGCTWYSKVSGFDGANRVIKIGCDYQHLYDMEENYNESYVYQQVKETIDSLWKITPIKKWCNYCGEYVLDSEHFDNHCINCEDK